LGKLLEGRFAVSSIVAVLIVILLVSTFTAALLYISTSQMQSAKTGTETTGKISEKLRENLKAALLSYDPSTGTATFNVTNTGEVPLAISYVLLVNPDGSLLPIHLSQTMRIIPLESRTFIVNIMLTSGVSRLGLQTERGNVFPVVVSGAVTQTATQTATVTFSASGLSLDASGTVLTVDSLGYSYGQLPISFTWTVDSSHSFTWSDPVSSTTSGKRYAWVSTSGLSTAKSGTIVVPSAGGAITATYKTQYQWTFTASGLSSDAFGTVVTVDGTNYGYSNLPVSFWWDSGTPHSYSYQQYVSTTTDGKRYANHSTPSGTITVSSSGSVSPSYHTEYRLTVSVSPSGAGSVSLNPSSSDGYYDAGTSVTAAAQASAGYTFSKWQLDGSDYSTSNPTNVNMNAPHSLTAVFTGTTYTLTIYVYRSGTTTGIQGVTIKVDGTSYTTDSSGKVQATVSYGSHTVEVVSPYSPSSGTRYVFTQWSGGSTSNPRTVSVTAATTLTAYMKLQYQLTVAVNPSGGGSVSANPSSSDGYYDSGTSVTLTATASSGYAFDAWTGAVTGTSSSDTVTMDGPKSVTANFFTFSISVSPASGSTPAGGSISATVTVTYVSGVNSKTISLSASGLPSGASSSFSPTSVTISPTSTTATSTMTITTSTSTPTGTYIITISGSGGGVSKSTSYTLTVTAPAYTVNFYIYDDAGSSVSSATLVFNSQSYSHGGSTSVTAGSYSLSIGTIPSGYRFKQWETSGGVSVASSTSTSTTATVSSSGSTTMRLQRTATVTFSASGLGSDAEGTVLNVDGTGYAYGDLPKSFTWDVGSQHSFAWALAVGSTTSGKAYVWVSTSGLSTRRHDTITVPSGGGSVVATYKVQYYLTMQTSPSGAGSVSPSSGWYDAGSSVQISATANSGCQFSRWSGSGSGSYSGTNNPASVTMNGPITETAYFKVGVTFDAVKTSGARFNSNPSNVLYLSSPISTWYSYSQLPVTVYLEPGASLYFSWNSPLYSREGYPSQKYNLNDAKYSWVSTSGYSTSQSATITVPSSPASITAKYDRYIYIYTDQYPYSGGTISPDSGYYKEGQSVTATPNSGYRLEYWDINDGSKTINVRSTSTASYTPTNPEIVKAVFYKRVDVLVDDAEYYTGANVPITFGGVTVNTDSYGRAVFYLPVFTYQTLSVPSYASSAVSGYSLPFWKSKATSELSWYTNNPRSVYISSDTQQVMVKYKCILTFRNPSAEWRFGPGTWFSYIYIAQGYVDVVTFKYKYSKMGINVKAVWHIHKEDLFGAHYYTREGTDATDNNGYYYIEINSGFMGDYYLVSEDLWVEVYTQAEEGYVNAYWTKGDF
jgi:hypothetical protein